MILFVLMSTAGATAPEARASASSLAAFRSDMLSVVCNDLDMTNVKYILIESIINLTLHEIREDQSLKNRVFSKK